MTRCFREDCQRSLSLGFCATTCSVENVLFGLTEHYALACGVFADFNFECTASFLHHFFYPSIVANKQIWSYALQHPAKCANSPRPLTKNTFLHSGAHAIMKAASNFASIVLSLATLTKRFLRVLYKLDRSNIVDSSSGL